MRIWAKREVPGAGEWGLAALATDQRGLVHRRQLRALGIGDGSIRHRRSRGSLHGVFPSVFAVGHAALEPLALETAALLHAGDDAVLSHGTAAALWDIVGDRPPDVHITVLGRKLRHRPALRVHRVETLDGRDVRLRHGLPLTAPARTMIDFADSASDESTSVALNEARLRGLVTDDQLEEAIGRACLRPGVGRLRRLLRAERGPAITRSEAERHLRRLVERGQLPWPRFNVWLGGYLVDALWPDHRLVLEVDGYDVHRRRSTFESDRRRDQRLTAAGFVVVRVTRRQLVQEPMAVLASLAQALALTQQRMAGI